MVNRRGHFREGLHKLYLPYYDMLCAQLPDHWQPMEGLRSMARQADLYASGRTKAGPIVTRALPGESLHNWGLASDWGFVEYPKIFDPPTTDPRWQEYQDICRKVGLRTIQWDLPHNEYRFRKTNIHQIYDSLRDIGAAAVHQLLEEERLP